jgi:3-oxoacyl-[acyl-carrier-protein] synthase-3
MVLGTDGSGARTFMVSAGGARTPRSAESAVRCQDDSGNVRTAEHLYMNGAAVLDFVKRAVPPLVAEVLAKAQLTMADLDLVLFHQASRVTLDQLYRALKIPYSKRFDNLEKIGNTVSASLPILLRDAELQGALRPGMKIMVVGWGVGMSWGGCVLEWMSQERAACKQ